MSARRLPGRVSACPVCKKPVVVAITVARESGRGGKHQMFEPYEDPAGNVAIVPRATGLAYARALKADETHDSTTELRGMPHAAVCQPPLAGMGTAPSTSRPPNVVDFAAAARRRKDGR